MQLVTTSCFLNSESSHSLALVSWSVFRVCERRHLCVLWVNVSWGGLHVCNVQSQFFSTQCGAPVCAANLIQVHGKNAQTTFVFCVCVCACMCTYANVCTSVASCVSVVAVFTEGWCNVKIKWVSLFFLSGMCWSFFFFCAIRKLMHHPPFWHHAVTFLLSWTITCENCVHIVSWSPHLSFVLCLNTSSAAWTSHRLATEIPHSCLRRGPCRMLSFKSVIKEHMYTSCVYNVCVSEWAKGTAGP